ncbi:4Fe-4S ferredoxin [Methanoculleus taiwanensis]|uniref:4Fe-4S ferredoxin n=1 Tax=Methanoculleus taiwanensis TaxID=1550565 RepID=A0A498H2K0_9EURY|nr:4Fe-4S dicluster domain-containing protein [Methanoculleus taiwanensis]RXE57013.1 4Fe-4S ferredoxin [Methanoculleus taiwanensis]
MGFFTMAKTVLQNLFGRPPTRRYPAVPARVGPITRGHVTIDPARCISCGLCMRRCPSQAIRVERAEKVWEIDRFRCIACDACVEACPAKCLIMESGYIAPVTEKEVERHPITYVKPERPQKKEAAEG